MINVRVMSRASALAVNTNGSGLINACGPISLAGIPASSRPMIPCY
jgi:hypothetical protein